MQDLIQNISTRCFVISGEVQGVFFRDNTKEVANRLRILGSAINQSDGTVKVIAKGDQDSLQQLFNWLLIGPRLAHVDDVKEVDINQYLQLNEFIIY
mgnify:CR=1 FL=1